MYPAAKWLKRERMVQKAYKHGPLINVPASKSKYFPGFFIKCSCLQLTVYHELQSANIQEKQGLLCIVVYLALWYSCVKVVYS